MKELMLPLLLTLHICGNAQEYRIVYSAGRGSLATGCHIDIKSAREDGSDERVLVPSTVNRRGEYNVSISPNEKQILFNTYRWGGWKLALANLDMTEHSISDIEKFTNNANYEFNTTWSPDEKTIALEVFDWNKGGDIYLTDISRSYYRNLTNSQGGEATPAWMNDHMLVMAYEWSDNYEITTIDVEKGALTRLTDHPAHDIAPSYSSGANRIAFLSDRNGSMQLYTINTDGSNLKWVSRDLDAKSFEYKDWQNSLSWAYKTSWSPDGKKIAFTAITDGDLDIFVIDSSGANLRKITNNATDDFGPVWINRAP